MQIHAVKEILKDSTPKHGLQYIYLNVEGR